MTFNDIFRSSFLENVSSFSVLDVAIAMGLAFALGLFIYLVYKKTFSGVMYSASFGISLVAMTLITTLIILAISSNIILSLGMVGALSIVRFRTAVKEPLDIAFLFWAISAGIVTGAGLLPLAVFGSLFIGVILVLFINRKRTDSPYILVVNLDREQTEQMVVKQINESVKKSQLKSKSISSGGIELTLEVQLKDMATDFINNISSLEGVSSAVLVSYNGDYMA